LAFAPRGAFWTVTLWRDLEAMRAYRRTGAHLAVMPRLLLWCDEAAVATLTGAEALPQPEEAARRLRAEGRVSKVRHPTEAHRSGATCPDDAAPHISKMLRPR
jgi:hypothetical protein